MTAVIVDDNASIRETLKTLLSIYTMSVNVLAEADGVVEGVKVIRENKPELVFLDVEMNDGTGFDLISRCGKIDFKVIFVTGHDSYAINAFRFSAIDYILKPVDPDDLVKAVEKAITSLSVDTDLKVSNYIQNKNSSKDQKRIVLSDAQNTYLISILDIIRCESDINYTHFYLQDGRQVMVSKTLKVYDELLSEFGFFRSHQSHLVNLRFFDRLDKTEGGVIFLKNGETIPISTRKREGLLQELNKF